VGAYRRAVQVGGKLHKAAVAVKALESSDKFGMRVISKAANPNIAGDVLTSAAVQGARTAVNVAQGEGLGVTDLAEAAIATTVPFIPAFNQARKSLRGSTSITIPAHPMVETTSATPEKLKEVLTEQDYTDIASVEELWTPNVRSEEHLEGMLELYDAGVPYADIMAMRNRADIEHYKTHGEYTANAELSDARASNPEARGLLKKHWGDKDPEGRIGDALYSPDFPDNAPKGAALRQADIIRLFDDAVGTPNTATVAGTEIHNPHTSPEPPRFEGISGNDIAAPGDGLSEADLLAEQLSNSRTPSGGSGRLGPNEIAPITPALDNMLTRPLATASKSRMGAAWDSGINRLAPIRAWFASTGRALDAMGGAGRQLKSLLQRSEMQYRTEAAARSSTVNNALEGIRDDPAKLRAVIRYFGDTNDFMSSQEINQLEQLPVIKSIKAVQREMGNQYTQLGVYKKRDLYSPNENNDGWVKGATGEPLVVAKLRTSPSDFMDFGDKPLKDADTFYEVMNSLTRWVDKNSKELAVAKNLGNPNGLYSFNEVGPWSELIPLQNNIKAWDELWRGVTEEGGGNVFSARVLGQLDDMSPRQILSAAQRAKVKDLPNSEDFLRASSGKSPQELIGDLYGAQSMADLTEDQVSHLFMIQRMSAEGLHSMGGVAESLVRQLGKDGYDQRYAREVVTVFRGLRSHDPNMVAFSKAVRNYNIITKLGAAVIENSFQSVFTATKFGFKNTLKAFRDYATDRAGTIENARIAGALSDDTLRSLEVEVGKTLTGKFLKGSGFAAVEEFNVSVAAKAGQHHFREQFMKAVGGNTKSRELLDRYGFDTSKWFSKDGVALSESGADIKRAFDNNAVTETSQAFERIAALKAVNETQMFAGMLENPLYQTTPMGKMIGQFKTFATGAVRFSKQAIVDEALAGNPRPFLRALVAAPILGEVSQDLRALAAGNDPRKRGQEGTYHDVFASILEDNDETVLKALGQRMGTSDIAARALENVLGIGYMGIVSSMVESSLRAGKVGAINVGLGPTIGAAAEVVGSGLQGLYTGDFSAIARKVQREGIAATGALPGIRNVPGAPFATTIAGRQSQVALNPSPFQTEQSFYQTPEESAAIGVKQVVRSYNSVRERVSEAFKTGDTQGAVEQMRRWNAGLPDKFEALREVGGLNSASAAKVSFNGADARRIRQTVMQDATKPGVFGQALQRVGVAP
jgi:hypothetical protein